MQKRRPHSHATPEPAKGDRHTGVWEARRQGLTTLKPSTVTVRIHPDDAALPASEHREKSTTPSTYRAKPWHSYAPSPPLSPTTAKTPRWVTPVGLPWDNRYWGARDSRGARHQQRWLQKLGSSSYVEGLGEQYQRLRKNGPGISGRNAFRVTWFTHSASTLRRFRVTRFTRRFGEDLTYPANAPPNVRVLRRR
jgi:hypothetical protein